MVKLIRNFALFIFAIGLAATLACSGQTQPGGTQANANAQPSSDKARATGTIAANPNPIQVCDRAGLGKTTLTWRTAGAADVELHSPDGTTLAKGTAGTYETGKWVYDGAEFYLQDVSQGKPLGADTKIAVVKVQLTQVGCP